MYRQLLVAVTGSGIGLVRFKAFVWGGKPPTKPAQSWSDHHCYRVSFLMVYFLASCLVLATDDFSFPQALERFLFSLEKTSSDSFSAGSSTWTDLCWGSLASGVLDQLVWPSLPQGSREIPVPTPEVLMHTFSPGCWTLPNWK